MYLCRICADRCICMSIFAVDRNGDAIVRWWMDDSRFWFDYAKCTTSLRATRKTPDLVRSNVRYSERKTQPPIPLKDCWKTLDLIHFVLSSHDFLVLLCLGTIIITPSCRWNSVEGQKLQKISSSKRTETQRKSGFLVFLKKNSPEFVCPSC